MPPRHPIHTCVHAHEHASAQPQLGHDCAGSRSALHSAALHTCLGGVCAMRSQGNDVAKPTPTLEEPDPSHIMSPFSIEHPAAISRDEPRNRSRSPSSRAVATVEAPPAVSQHPREVAEDNIPSKTTRGSGETCGNMAPLTASPLSLSMDAHPPCLGTRAFMYITTSTFF